jgi:hypothetical protein
MGITAAQKIVSFRYRYRTQILHKNLLAGGSQKNIDNMVLTYKILSDSDPSYSAHCTMVQTGGHETANKTENGNHFLSFKHLFMFLLYLQYSIYMTQRRSIGPKIKSQIMRCS